MCDHGDDGWWLVNGEDFDSRVPEDQLFAGVDEVLATRC